MTGTLPVGVVIPTLDSMRWLPAHVEALNAWIQQVPEVVVVDSDSQDGTPEYLRANLRHPALRVVSHPRGLYASWNHAIGLLQSEFTYIATVGDRMANDGVAHLVEVARALEADVVVSPPAFEHAGGTAHKDEWPVHEILRWLDLAKPALLAPRDAYWIQIYYRTSSLLGSSASNLYRSACLQRRPFPTDCGSAGDVGWAWSNLLHVRLAVTPRPVATFLLHPPRRPDLGRLDEHIEACIEEVLEAGDEGVFDPAPLRKLQHLTRRLARCDAAKARAKAALAGAKAAGRAGFLTGDARRGRARRNQLRRVRKRLVHTVESTWAEILPGFGDGKVPWL